MAKGATVGERRRRRRRGRSGRVLGEDAERSALDAGPGWVRWIWGGNVGRLLISVVMLAIAFSILRAAWAAPGEPWYNRRADGAVGVAVLLIPPFVAQLVQTLRDVVRRRVSSPVFHAIGRWADRLGPFGVLGLMVAISALWVVVGH